MTRILCSTYLKGFSAEYLSGNKRGSLTFFEKAFKLVFDTINLSNKNYSEKWKAHPFPMLHTYLVLPFLHLEWWPKPILHCLFRLAYWRENFLVWGSLTQPLAFFLLYTLADKCNQRKYECYHYPNNPSSDCVTSSCIKPFNASKNSEPSRVLNHPIYSMAWPEALIFFR